LQIQRGYITQFVKRPNIKIKGLNEVIAPLNNKRRNNAKFRRLNQMNDKERLYIKKLRADGISMVKISKLTNIPYNTIKSYFRRHSNKLPNNFKCLNCGKELRIVRGKKTKKFCNDSCRMNYWNSHQYLIKKKAYYSLTCSFCGKEFLSYGNKNRKFCSRDCYKKSLTKIQI